MSDNTPTTSEVTPAAESAAVESPAAPAEEQKPGLVAHLVWPALASFAVWCVWAFGASRGARYPMSALQGHDGVTPGLSGLLLLALVALSGLLLSSRTALRSIVAVALPVVAVATGWLTGVRAGYDAGAYVFVLLAVVAAAVLVLAPRATHVSARRLTPVLALGVILASQALSPAVPNAAYEAALVPGDVTTLVEAFPGASTGDLSTLSDVRGPACTDEEDDFSASGDGWMVVSSLCAMPAAQTLALVAPDGCHDASDAYAMLALLQGPDAGNPELAAEDAQSYLTGSWLRGRAKMESGFCVQTTDGTVRTFTTPDKVALYTVTLGALEG